MKRSILFTAICSVVCAVYGQKNADFQAYIDKYAELAIKEQERHDIPASITMAQALLESQAGSGRLAVEGNNHFGIKCAGDWDGATIYHDDDRLGECFRKYKKVIDSYEDHSQFLKRQRYAFLFQYDVKDYKSWAYGLSRAGYATDPEYPAKLIRIIETYNLNDLVDKAPKKEKNFYEDEPNYEQLWGYIEIENNGVRCVRVITPDKIDNVAKAFNIPIKKLLYYNDLMDNMTMLHAQDYVYLWVKKNHADPRYETHKVAVGESMHDISQLYGIKLKKLYKLNNLSYGTPAKVGMVLRLQ
ncbi:MAG: glucosaminidase domain-containing protein [Paludibacteraceae bacterium]